MIHKQIIQNTMRNNKRKMLKYTLWVTHVYKINLIILNIV